MASKEVTPPEGFTAFNSGGFDDDEPTVDLEPGDTLQGIVLDVSDGENEHGPWYRLRMKDEERGVIRYFAKDEVKRAAREGRIVEGEAIWVGRGVTEETFTNDEGKEQPYHPTSVAFPGEGD